MPCITVTALPLVVALVLTACGDGTGTSVPINGTDARKVAFGTDTTRARPIP